MTHDDMKAALQLLAEERLGRLVRAEAVREDDRIAQSKEALRRAGLAG
jgi:hypothetical protein